MQERESKREREREGGMDGGRPMVSINTPVFLASLIAGLEGVSREGRPFISRM
jgi:hypothetical protein